MDSRKLLILTAVQIEARAVYEALSLHPAGPRVWRSEPAQRPAVELQVVGVRAVQLPDGVNRQNTRLLIMAGVAGALDPSLKVGDIIVDDFPAGAEGSRPARLRQGTIHTSQTIVGTPAQKAELWAQTHALAADMENARVREWAAALGIPFVAVRAISDAAHEALDPAVLGFIDPFGNVKPAAMAATLLRKPGMIPDLLRLGASAKLARQALGRAIAEIVRCFV